MNDAEPRFVVIGFGSEVVTAHFINYISSRSRPYRFLDLDTEVMDPKWHLTLGRDRLIWSNSNGDFSVQYDTPIYHRFFIRPEPETKNALRLQEAFDVFTAFCNAAPDWALIVNRPLSGAMNWAKVAHMRSIARHGFQVPIALTTNKRERLQEFPVPAINKGCSGTRSIAEQADATVVQSLSDWLIVPAMLQQYIGGPDVRVHFIGYEHSALMFKTQFDDYRYASKNGFELESQVTTLRPDLVDKCYSYMRSERLEFAGFDFKIDGDGDGDGDGGWWLLEVNPMPGFAFFLIKNASLKYRKCYTKNCARVTALSFRSKVEESFTLRLIDCPMLIVGDSSEVSSRHSHRHRYWKGESVLVPILVVRLRHKPPADTGRPTRQSKRRGRSSRPLLFASHH